MKVINRGKTTWFVRSFINGRLIAGNKYGCTLVDALELARKFKAAGTCKVTVKSFTYSEE